MRRRNVLRGAALGTVPVLSGCATIVGQDRNTDTGRTERSTGTAEARECEPVSGHSSPADTSLAVDVSIPDETGAATARGEVFHPASSENPVRVEIRFQNTSGGPTEYQFGAVPPLADLILEHESQDTRLLLVPDPLPDSVSIIDRNDDGEFDVLPDSRIDDCWRAVDVPLAEDSFNTLELGPCEVHEASFHVLAHPDDAGCLPAGRYERTDQWTIRHADAGGKVTVRIDVSRPGET